MTDDLELYVRREAERLGSARTLRRQFEDGTLVRVATGVYANAADWRELNRDGRYRARVRAAALRSAPGAQFSHDSAAVLYRLPSIGAWPSTVHEVVPRTPGGTSRRGIRRHALGLDPESMTIDGVTVTSLARTVIDVACTQPFVRSVAMLDQALRPARQGEPRWELGFPLLTAPQLAETLDQLGLYPGRLAAARAIGFADGGAGSPIESQGRVQFHALGLEPPELQVEFFDDEGSIGFADWYWRSLDLIAEADGKSKYGPNRHFQPGMSLEELVMREKRREDRLRRKVRAFARLDAQTIDNRRALATRMAEYGLVPRAVFGRKRG
jgi:hypothetical protein